jgi:hypothetical protein
MFIPPNFTSECITISFHQKPIHSTVDTMSLSADLTALLAERKQAIYTASSRRVAAQKTERQALLDEQRAWIDATATQSAPCDLRAQLPHVLCLARATRDYLLADMELARCRVKELESVLDALRDRVERADGWVQSSYRQVGDVLNAMVDLGIDESSFSDSSGFDYFADLTDSEFSEQFSKHSDGSEDSDGHTTYSDCNSERS